MLRYTISAAIVKAIVDEGVDPKELIRGVVEPYAIRAEQAKVDTSSDESAMATADTAMKAAESNRKVKIAAASAAGASAAREGVKDA